MEEEEAPSKYEFEQEINDLVRLHVVTKKFNHGIEFEKGSWKMFEPSKFVYTFFAFNTFYNFDWIKSCENNVLTLFDKIEKEGKIQDPNEGLKYKSMIDFIYENLSENEITTSIKQHLENNNEGDCLIQCIKEITVDKRISSNEREGFKKEFECMIKGGEMKKAKLKNEIIRFIYLVRNNIFHGTKDTIEMSESNQRKRLEIYSNILIGVNELLFKSLEIKLNTKFERNYKLNFDDRS